MKRPHYAWMVCASCALLLFVSMGLCSNAFGVYQPFIISEYGFSYTEASLITTIRTIAAFVCILYIEYAFARMGFRRTVVIGLGFGIASYLIFAFTETFPAYCIASAFSGITYSWAGMVPLSRLITHWFYDRRGIAMGLSVTGSGVASIIMPPIITTIVQNHGIREAFLLEALIMLCVGMLIFRVIVEDPEQISMKPYGAPELKYEIKTGVFSEGSSEEDLFRKQNLKMILAALCIAGPAGPGFNHLSVLFTTEGHTYDTASSLMSAIGIGLLFGKIIVGYLYDKLGSKKANGIVLVSLILAMLMCSIAPARTSAIAFGIIVLLGIGLASVSVSMAIWARDINGSAKSDHAMKIYSTAYSFGMMLFGPIPGMIADATGRYVQAYALFAFMALIATILLSDVYAKLN